MATHKHFAFRLLLAFVSISLCCPASRTSAIDQPHPIDATGVQIGSQAAAADEDIGIITGLSAGAGEKSPRSDWTIQTVLNVPVSFPAVALDAAGRPQIAFKDTHALDMKVTRYDGTAWQTDIIEDSGNPGNFAAIALDSNQLPHMAWDNYVTHNLRYGSYNGLARKIQNVAEWAWARYISIYLDEKDYPHVSYSADSSDTIRYSWQDGKGWHQETVDTIRRDIWLDMAADNSNQPHLVYQTAPAAPYYLKYAWRDGSWHTEIVATSGYGPVAIALDASGLPHIIRYNMTSGLLEHFWKQAGTWQVAPVAFASYGPISFSYDQHNHPHIVYTFLDGDIAQVSYATNPGSGWQVDVVAQGQAYAGALALDTNNSPWIVFAGLDGGTLQLARRASQEFPSGPDPNPFAPPASPTPNHSGETDTPDN